MDNPVIIRAAEVAQALGVSTLRFNFRGVGDSTGAHDEGRGEQDDCSAALALLRSRLPPASTLSLLGYSFGARIAAQVGEGRADLDGLALVAPPLAMYSFDGLYAGRPLLLAAGSRDPYCPVQDLVKLAERVGTEPRIIEGADHFFFGKLFPLGTAVEFRWVRPSRAGYAAGCPAARADHIRSRGKRAGVAVPAERMMRMPSSTVSPVVMISSRGSTMTSPR